MSDLTRDLMTGKQYLAAVHGLPCCICGTKPVSGHHAVGGSMVERLGPRGQRKHSDYMALPLCHDHHQGANGIHNGVLTWEAEHGKQVDLVTATGKRLGMDPWVLEAAEATPKKRYSRLAKILPRRGHA